MDSEDRPPKGDSPPSEELGPSLLSNLLQKSPSPCVLFRLSMDGSGCPGEARILYCNAALLSLVGLAEEDVVQRPARDVLSFANPQFLEELDIIALTGCGRKYEQYIEIAQKYFEILLLSVGDMKIAAYMTDVTRRREREDSLTAALRKNSLLLKELHHRVKNNLQMMISLVSLQRDALDHSRSRDALWAVESRLRAISFANDLYLSSLHTKTIEVSVLLRGLTDDLLELYGEGGGGGKADVRLEGAALHVIADSAVPLALIANEIVGNSLKHSRPRDEHIDIVVAWFERGDGGVGLSFRDNGGGFPEGAVDRACASSGIRIVRALVEQLSGNICFSNHVGGACVELTLYNTLSRGEEPTSHVVFRAPEGAAALPALAPFADKRAAGVLSQSGLSVRQSEIMQHVVRGETSKEIAFAMGISVSTVKNHLAALFRKFGVASRIELINRLKQLQLLPD